MYDNNRISAFLYMHLSEPMPDAGCTEAEFEQWATGTDDIEQLRNEVLVFVASTHNLIEGLRLEYYTAEPDYMKVFYDVAKETFGEDKRSIFLYFKMLYLVVFEKPTGPRWGDFVKIYGLHNFIEKLTDRLNNI
jgi:lysyl-tRNA synthetase class I